MFIGEIEDRVSGWLFGRTAATERAPDDVDALVDGAPTTGLLMEFGESVLKANSERISAIDAKATMIVGYSVAILAFLLTRGPSLVGQPVWLILPILLAAVMACWGCFCGGLTLRAARGWQNPGEATWFPDNATVVADQDSLRRWYLKAMHQSFQQNHRITDQKAGELIKAQLSVAAAGIFLGLAFIADAVYAIYRHIYPPF